MSTPNSFDPQPYHPQGGGFTPIGGFPPGGGFTGAPPSEPGPQTFVWGVLSLLAAALSVFSCCCVYVSAPAGLFSVVFGLLAVRGADGRLMGAMGMFLGGAWAVLVVGVNLWLTLNPPDPNRPTAAGDPTRAAFVRAELEIMSGARAKGNSAEARLLAEQFSDTMKSLREEFFTADKKRLLSLSDGEFITWCELHEDSCVFLVHVPNYRKFSDDAKESLNEIAWVTAQQVARVKLSPGDVVGLGMKGVLLYDIVRTGELPENEDDEIDPSYDGQDKDELLPYFPADPPPASLPAEPNAPDAKPESAQTGDGPILLPDVSASTPAESSDPARPAPSAPK